MKQKTPFAAKIAFRLPTSLYLQLNAWAEKENRPLANLIYSIVKQAVISRENEFKGVDTGQNTGLENAQ